MADPTHTAHPKVRRIVALCLWLSVGHLSPPLASAKKIDGAVSRTWTRAKDGQTVKAVLTEVRGGDEVRLRRGDARTLRIRLDQLSPQDQAYIRSQLETASPSKGNGASLRYRDCDDLTDPVLSRCMVFVPSTSKKPNIVTKAPQSSPKRQLRYLFVRSAATPFAIAVQAGSKPRIMVDCDADGDLAEETPLLGRSPPKESSQRFRGAKVFGPISLQQGQTGNEVKIRILLHERYAFIFPAGYRSGRVDLGGKKRRVAVLDLNFDGQYLHGLHDKLAVDFNKDGKLGRLSSSGPTEIQPLTKLVLYDNRYFAVDVTPDGSMVSFSETEPEMGTIALGNVTAELGLVGDAASLSLTTTSKGLIELPAGSYQCTSVLLKDGAWSLSCRGNTGKLRKLEVTAGETIPLTLGAPLTAKAEVRRTGAGVVYISATLVGQAGEKYAPGATRKGRRQPAPKFKILSEKGKKLASGQFEYG